jgi:hypothetical protein
VGPKYKVPKIEISRNCFSKEKPVDRAGPVHRGPATIAALRSSTRLRPRGGGGEGRAGEFNDGVAAVREAVEGRLTGGGASTRKGGGEGTLRAKRRNVGGAGVFTEGGVAFYRVELRWGWPGSFNVRHLRSLNAPGLKALVTRD